MWQVLPWRAVGRVGPWLCICLCDFKGHSLRILEFLLYLCTGYKHYGRKHQHLGRACRRREKAGRNDASHRRAGKALRQAHRGQRRFHRRQAGGDCGVARAQRGRQDHVVLHDHRPYRAQLRPHLPRRPRHIQVSGVQACAGGHRLSCPGEQCVPQDERRRQHTLSARDDGQAT